MNIKKVMVLWILAAMTGLPVLSDEVLNQFDWRNVEGKCYVTPVKTVTDVSRIWATVTADMLESLYLIQSGIDYNKLGTEDKEKMAVSVESILAECEHVPGMAPDKDPNQGEGKDVTKTYEYLLRKGYQSKARVTDILLWQGITNAQEENSEEWLDRLSSAKAGLQRKPIFSYCYMSDNYTDSKYYFMCPHSYVTTDRCRENYRPVLVIGYDDTIPAARFKHKNFDEIPAGDGAWIVKGVHGDGIDGTFYVSYYDKNLFKYEYESFFVYPEFIAEQTQQLTLDLDNEFGQFYCHNEGSPAGIDMQDLYPRCKCANMFLASSDDMLSALGAFRMSFSTVEVSVYTNCVAGDPVSGALATKVKVRCDHWGYNIRRMTEQIPIKKGQWFSLVTDDTDMLVWTKSTNPQQGRSFVCPPRSEWRDAVSLNGNGVLEGNYKPKWWTRGGLSGSTCDTPFLTAYTANEQKDIELQASDGEVEEGIYVTWTHHENGIYDLYRRGSNGVESLIASGLTQAMHFDMSEEHRGEVKLDEKYYYRVINRKNNVESNTDEGLVATRPRLESVKVAKLWLTGEGPYNVKLEWNKYNTEVYQVDDGDFEMKQPKTTAKRYHSTVNYIGISDGEKIVNLAQGGNVIESGNHGEYKMDLNWKYTNRKSKLPKNGETKKDITVKVYFDKYKKYDGGLANWFYYWKRDKAISAEYFDNKLLENSTYDNKFHYTQRRVAEGYRGECLPEITFAESWEGPDSFELCKVTGVKCVYRVTDLAAAIGEVIKPHSKHKPNYWGPSVGVESKGINCLADVLQHERRHYEIWTRLYEIKNGIEKEKYVIRIPAMKGGRLIYYDTGDQQYAYNFNSLDHLQWAQKYKRPYFTTSPYFAKIDELLEREERGELLLARDLDGDGISDNDENNVNLLWPGRNLNLDPTTNDTYSLVYDKISDQEILARMAEEEEETNDVIKVKTDNDWAFPGSNIAEKHEGYQNADWEVLGNSIDKDYRFWNYDKDDVKQMLWQVGGEEMYDNEDWDWRYRNRSGYCPDPQTTRSVQTGTQRYQTKVILDARGKYLSKGGEKIMDEADKEATDVISIVSLQDGIACDEDHKGHFASLCYPLILTNYSENAVYCLITGSLAGSNETVVAEAQSRVVIAANSSELVVMTFSGDCLYETMSDRFAMHHVEVQSVSLDTDESICYISTNLNVTTCEAYAWSDFAPKDGYVHPDKITECFVDSGLIISMDVEINGEESLDLVAILETTNGEYIAAARTNGLSWVGTQTVSVTFPREQIAYAKRSGEYVVSLVQLLKGSDVVWGRRNVYTTKEYQRESFLLDNHVLSIDEQSFAHADLSAMRGVSFSFDVSNRTSEVVAYRVKGFLFGTNETYVCSAITNVVLEPGVNNIMLSFAADEIAGQGCGPYWVREVVLDPGEGIGERDHFYPVPLYFGEDVSEKSFVFQSGDVVVSEGSSARILVCGGHADHASSVNVYLTYSTAASADVDLARGTVDGVTPKGGLKFPLTLTWEKGEVGEKVITIPVKADKTVEGDEFFTLQLANPVGMEVGEARVCTVTIKDANTFATLQDGVMNPNIKVTSKGDGAWLLGEGSSTDTKELSGLYHLESPLLAQGESATFSLGSLKGNGIFYFHLRFTGDAGESVPSRLAVYDGNVSLGYVDHTVMTNGWIEYWITDNGGSASTKHTYSFVFTQGSDPNTHAEIAEIRWINSDIESVYRVLAMSNGSSGGYVSGSGSYEKGQTAKLTAKPFPGWSFDGWYVVEFDQTTDRTNYSFWNKSASVSYKVTTNLNVTAFFSKIPYIRGLADPADGGKVSGSGLCDKGKKVTLKATANKNFTFVGWVVASTGETPVVPVSGSPTGETPVVPVIATTASLVIDRTAKPAANSKTSTTITDVDGDVTYYAVFKSDPKVTVEVAATDEKGAGATGKGAGKYVAGTITGAGKYASGKKVTLKATANKGYVFAGWSDAGGSQLAATEADAINCVPPAVLNGQDARSASVSFAMPSNDVALVAQFVTADEDKQSIWLAVDGVEMRRVEDNAPYRTNVWCGVYLEWPIEVDALSLPTVKVTGLPSGLKFADKPVTTKVGTGKAAVVVTNVPANTIYGAPTAASKTTTDKKTGAAKPSEVKVTVTTAGKSSQTYQIDTTVDALPAWAQGTFQGAMVATGETPVVPVNGQDARSTSGIASLTVSAAGKVSGKAQGEFAYTLAAPYYSGFEVATEGDVASGGETLVSNFLADVTASWSYKEGSKTVKTNDVVQMTVRDNGVGGVVTGGARPVAPEGADAQERVPPSWTAWQYNWKVEPWKKLGKSFDKKTQVYAILADGTFSDSEEHVRATLGAEVTGRVTLKFAASGAVIVAGEFVTGYNEKTKKYTTVKASGSATLVPLDAERGAVFIYLAPKGLSPHACCLTVSWPEE